MTLFFNFLRSPAKDHESRLPLPPWPSRRAASTRFSIPTEISSASLEVDLERDTKDEREISAYDGFESLCKQYEQKLEHLELLQSAHQEALSTIKDLQSQLAQNAEEIKRAIEAAQSQVRTLSAQLQDVTAQNRQLRGQKDRTVANLQAELRQQQKSFANREKEQRTREKKLSDENQATSKALARAEQAFEEQRVLCERIVSRADEAQRLPSGILRSTFAARFVQPFVVVLVDGDAYKFTQDLTQDPLHGGSRAAHRIKTEVINYMATHNENYLHSKVMVRVFFNASSTKGKLRKNGHRDMPAINTFMIQFSEAHPLFDFLDCGSGKERADTKIRHNFELFIDNPYCRAMFLAVCYDGGFVRMLEPYQHSQDAVNKIVLIKAGQVAPGFVSVPLFKFTEFTSVFHERYSLKLSPAGKTLNSADQPRPADSHLRRTLSSDNEQDPEDLPIGHVPYAPWKHPRGDTRSTATLVGLAYQATLLGAMGREAMPTPELIAFYISPLQRCRPNGRRKAIPPGDGKRRIKLRIQALQNSIRQKQQAANQPGISTNLQKILRLTVRDIEKEVARLKLEVAQRIKSN